jgi:hypothetical protein
MDITAFLDRRPGPSGPGIVANEPGNDDRSAPHYVRWREMREPMGIVSNGAAP